METVTMQLSISPEQHAILTEIAKERQKPATEVLVEAVMDFLERQLKLREGRRILMTMPQRAVKRSKSIPADLASSHDKYLYD